MDTYVLARPVNYGGTDLDAGDSIELSPEQAAVYRAEGLIAPAPGDLDDDFDADAALAALHDDIDIDADDPDDSGAEDDNADPGATAEESVDDAADDDPAPSAPEAPARRGRKPKGA